MKKFLLIILILLISPTLFSQQTSSSLGFPSKFVLITQDGSWQAQCTHHLLNNHSPWDWKVFCQNGSFKRHYSVHLLVRKHLTVDLNNTLESHFWVTRFDSSFKAVLDTFGSTSWLRLNNLIDINSLELSVDTENIYMLRTTIANLR